MERLVKLVVSGVLAVSLLGCATGGHYHHHHHGGGAGALLATGVIAGALIGAAATSNTRSSDRSYSSTTYYVQSPPPPPPAPPPADDDLPPFDAGAARAALGAVDVTSCGGPEGYGHARITMNPDGKISRVKIEDPNDIDGAIAVCIGRKLGRVTVAPFRGSMVVVGTSFRMN